eukprot:CAMPEP_0178396670 /NCGR_PEP_ID=MMETSP0689_2-20121128/13847_1 /TAXON_ID=160604 /ORGANISM="Amphidinium massartii, Strain CS-259" /LENGTH=147 /DNA_ID=CAMNT_0020017349 /DNA_START=142 /DNA_END=584 /DNA_ORIENTATION=-
MPTASSMYSSLLLASWITVVKLGLSMTKLMKLEPAELEPNISTNAGVHFSIVMLASIQTLASMSATSISNSVKESPPSEDSPSEMEGSGGADADGRRSSRTNRSVAEESASIAGSGLSVPPSLYADYVDHASIKIFTMSQKELHWHR